MVTGGIKQCSKRNIYEITLGTRTKPSGIAASQILYLKYNCKSWPLLAFNQLNIFFRSMEKFNKY